MFSMIFFFKKRVLKISYLDLLNRPLPKPAAFSEEEAFFCQLSLVEAASSLSLVAGGALVGVSLFIVDLSLLSYSGYR